MVFGLRGAQLTRRIMASPLLLLVHGRSGGAIPDELSALAAALEQRRGAAVLLQALTAAAPPPPLAGPGGLPLTLVPLLLLPGTHVRADLPAVAAHWRRQGPLRRLPFLGAWPAWQRVLAAEVTDLQARAATASQPLLLHHPLEGALAGRYLNHLGRRCAARCLAAPYSSAQSAEPPLAIDGPVLPLALAANRLTEAHGGLYGPPLLARERCRKALLTALGDLL
jgi:sirohydrochlorin ferrochelatase